ncbi:hypothetical protein A6V36_18095 [Paraburkholderia ginsengiterrae]|uniref:Pyridine nucleotide-disulfide oxidoreductase n=1 Tax=Paraburkholderia ginsengiterrae TaxID=1462993 RepID=A0A1A9MXA0_9BURK|nr:FAD-dependent oxidoreductase [Paraburkholderia ginsengiterrae]OAJ52044.1 hypothetical protein A6V37_10275 [Paraburkholderia ginsengiterrae]OAJ63406.1 hypothetical protein A6V36_18095 [Paraburkholderia ginsengiterrae]
MKTERHDAPIVVIGGGLTGVHAVESLRKAGFAGRIILSDKESRLPYDRPPLSKSVLLEKEKVPNIQLRNQAFYENNKVELKFSCGATQIDRQARVVRFDDGSELPYDQLLLATGSSPRTLPMFAPSMPGVFYLRNLDDSLNLRDALRSISRVLIVGAGVIGLEVAAAARELGVDVTVIEAAERPMQRAACRVVADYIRGRHEAMGVEILTGVTIAFALTRDGQWHVTSTDGRVMSGDAVVVGVGVAPNIDLAQAAGLETSPRGIEVDGYGRTTDPFIYAAGEVAYHFNTRSGQYDRQENWHHAAAHGTHVGRAMVAPSDPYEEICGYWSDQYDFSLQCYGSSIGERDILRGEPTSDRFCVFHTVDGVVAGVSAINASRDLRIGKLLVRTRARIPESVLSDASADLTSWSADSVL